MSYYLLDYVKCCVQEYESLEDARRKNKNAFIHPGDGYHTLEEALKAFEDGAVEDLDVSIKEICSLKKNIELDRRIIAYVKEVRTKRYKDGFGVNKRNKRSNNRNTKGSRKASTR